MEASVLQLEINTLLRHASHQEDGIIQSIIPISSPLSPPHSIKAQRSGHLSTKLEKFLPECVKGLRFQEVLEKHSDLITKEETNEHCLCVNGNDINDLPTRYEITGLKQDEQPVIGTYVDQRICPGFKYLVRLPRQDRYLFSEQPLYLQSIGRGYGKRITFEGESNYNSNYFYSDSNDEGFGFGIVALEAGDAFVVCNEHRKGAGQGLIQKAWVQKEMYSEVDRDGNVIKHIAVRFTCSVKYGASKSGLLPLCSQEILQLSGIALVVKSKGCRKAKTKMVHQLELPNYGPCVLRFSK